MKFRRLPLIKRRVKYWRFPTLHTDRFRPNPLNHWKQLPISENGTKERKWWNVRMHESQGERCGAWKGKLDSKNAQVGGLAGWSKWSAPANAFGFPPDVILALSRAMPIRPYTTTIHPSVHPYPRSWPIRTLPSNPHSHLSPLPRPFFLFHPPACILRSTTFLFFFFFRRNPSTPIGFFSLPFPSRLPALPFLSFHILSVRAPIFSVFIERPTHPNVRTYVRTYVLVFLSRGPRSNNVSSLFSPSGLSSPSLDSRVFLFLDEGLEPKKERRNEREREREKAWKSGRFSREGSKQRRPDQNRRLLVRSHTLYYTMNRR